MNNWLEHKPFVNNKLLISYNYFPEEDDTKTIKIYSYPKLEYLGEFESSRKNHIYTRDMYPSLIKEETVDSIWNGKPIKLNTVNPVPPLRIIRDLYPNLSNNTYLEKIHIFFFSTEDGSCRDEFTFRICDTIENFEILVDEIMLEIYNKFDGEFISNKYIKKIINKLNDR